MNASEWLRLVFALSAWKALVKYLFYLVIEILQLVHEINCFPEVL